MKFMAKKVNYNTKGQKDIVNEEENLSENGKH